MFDLYYDPALYIEGMYALSEDVILLDRVASEEYSNLPDLYRMEYIIAHEYAHRMYQLFMDRIYCGKRKQPSVLNVPLLTGPKVQVNPLDEIKKWLETRIRDKKTEDEKRLIEFDTYFEESFVVSVGLYQTKQMDDLEWIRRSAVYKGKILSKDEKFTETLEQAFYRLFFDRLFSHGLKQVTAELPVSYNILRRIFDKRYQKLLEHLPIIL